MGEIKENIERIKKALPVHVAVVAAAKSQPPEKIAEAIKAGIGIIGENYVQEAAGKKQELGTSPDVPQVQWHMIGHLQSNKVKKAVEIFDMIQTVDSFKLAEEINKRGGIIGKVMPCLVEVNIGREKTKGGCMPEELPQLLEELGKLESIKIKGLMCLEPFSENPENAGPYFAEMKGLFEKSKPIGGVEMEILSMGTSNSWKVAVEEGSNMVRVGTAIFGPRGY